jgi:hypothetical protein
MRVMDITRIGAAGLFSASARFEASARRTASGEGDLATGIVERIEAKTAFSASAAVIRTGDEMFERLLDIRA